MRHERYLEEVALRGKSYYRWSDVWGHDRLEFYGVTFVPQDDPYRTDEDRQDGYAMLALRFPGRLSLDLCILLPRRRAEATVASG